MTAQGFHSPITWVFEGEPYPVQEEAVEAVPIIDVVYLYETIDGVEVIVGQEDVLLGYEYQTVLVDLWADGPVWASAYRDVLYWIAYTAEIVARIAPPRLTARLQERRLDLHVFAAERSTP